MLGDRWESRRTGNIYRVGAPGTSWAVVGHAGTNALATFLGYFAALAGLSLIATVWAAIMTGILLGAVVMYLPAVLPLTVPLALVGFIVVGVRGLVTKRRLMPVGLAAVLLLIFLILAICNALFWYEDGPGVYRTLASVPVMAVACAVIGVPAVLRQRRAVGALFLAQAVVFASAYLDAMGNRTFANATLRYDNLLSLATWLLLVAYSVAWFAPRRGEIVGVTDRL